MKKQLTSFILILTMILTILPQFSLAVFAATAPDTSIGLDFTNCATDWTGTGSYAGVSWVSSTNTLTLTNANIHGIDNASGSYGITIPDGTTIILNGSNTVTGGISTTGNNNSYGLYCASGSGNFTIQGTGSLVATGGSSTGGTSCGIYCGSVTISGGNVTATGGSTGPASTGSRGIWATSTVTISGGNVTATGGSANTSIGMGAEIVNLNGGILIARGGVGNESKAFRNLADGISTINTSNSVDCLTGSPAANYAVYGDASAYKVNTTGLDFSSSPVDTGDLATDGYQWVQSTNTLTISNLVINTTALSGINLPAGATLDVQSTNVVRSGDSATESAQSYGINSAGDLTIQGTGTITAIGGNLTGTNMVSCGIYAVDNINISNATINAFGGTADRDSYGINSYDGSSSINISSGNVTAIGGTATTNSITGDFSCGIYQSTTITISGGNITAMGGTVNHDIANTASAGLWSALAPTISGGNIAAIGGVTAYSSNGNSSGIYRNTDGPSTIAGGNVTAIGNVAAFHSLGLSLSNNEGATLASINIDGSSPVSYVNANLGTYKYLTVGPTYTATVNLKKDGSTWTGSGKTITLQQASETPTTTTESSGVFTANVANGTWKILADGTDTGLTVAINNGAASQDINYYTATVNLNKDGSAWTSSAKSITLQQASETPAPTSEASGIFTASVANGTWKILVDGIDTGRTVVINNGAASQDINYYTVNFAAANSGAASGSTISAAYNSSPINPGDVVLGGNQLVITAVGQGAGSYTYAWSGAGTNSETTAALTILSLSSSVDATCSVAGIEAPPVITTASLPDGTVNTAYNQSLSALAITPVSWSIVSGFLPPGLTMNTNTGAITGTPTTAGTNTFTVQASNCHGSDAKTYTVTVAAPSNSNENGGSSGYGTGSASGVTITAKIVDESDDNNNNSTPVATVNATVGVNPDGTDNISVKQSDAVVIKQPDGSITPFGDYSKIGYTAPSSAPVTVRSDGTVQVSNLAKESSYDIPVTYDMGNGRKITIGNMHISVDNSGNVNMTSNLIDPYGIITDALSGNVINGANVTLYYADTARNKTAGIAPNTVVKLPSIDGFKPNNNQNPQTTDSNGAYGFMVYPNTDYYIVVTKDGYDTYTSSTISVATELVKFSAKLNPSITDVIRIAGSTRIDTAIEIAKSEFTGKVSSIVFATADNYPDALAGSVLAYQQKAPILLIGHSQNDQNKVLTYMKDYVASNGKVFILGGTGVVTDDFANHVKAAGYSDIVRLGGKDRYETATKIADYLNISVGTPVVIASGENYPDALAVSSAAAVHQYPILLVTNNAISDLVKSELAKIKPSKVYIIGRQGAISDAVRNQIAQITALDSSSIVRLGGADRYSTSVAIATNFKLSGKSTCIATGSNFPDALAGSIYAANYNAPIILVGDALTDEEKAYIQISKLSGATIFGGKGAVSDEIKNEVTGLLSK